MNTSLKDRSLTRSANFSSSTSKLRQQKPLKTANSSLSKTTADSISYDNIEIEYIKNLQQQVYFLELECNYLRKQLEISGLATSLNLDKQKDLLKQKSTLERSLNIAEKPFQADRDFLLQEVNMLKKQKLDLEEALLSKNIELSKVKENLNRHHLENSLSSQEFSKVESQVDNLRKDNLLLREEINEARGLLISRDSLIKTLQQELADTNNRKINNELRSSFNDISLKLSMTNELLGKESNNSKLLLEQNTRYERELIDFKARLNELNAENSRLSVALEQSLKQNEADLVLAKQNANASKLNLEQLKSDLDRERALNANISRQLDELKAQERLDSKSQASVKKRIGDLEEGILNRDASIKTLQEQLKQKQRDLDAEKAYHDSLNTANRNLESKVNELQLSSKTQSDTSKTKLTQLQAELDNMNMTLNNEINSNKSLQLKIEGLNRQETVNLNLISSLRQRITELESLLQEHTLKEPKFLSQLQETNLNMTRLEEENSRLRSEIDLLSVRLKEIDRLKQLEDLIQSQRWHELGDLADSMKNLSLMMSSTTGTQNNLTS